ncbi:hypothetical protein K458DRAFT_13174 [Lentithecium fluviatile CBS 122367]|uniref:Uncharacterized protein n=1 Tax=Lentithecium fluviatile CBS 122367 TaxID=1168545 RepID=A0A6G1J4P1_9PLEO|nr:hypothetical protein K458DRAFT_13174 [Lentithecium fluviatile CBS 122367]
MEGKRKDWMEVAAGRCRRREPEERIGGLLSGVAAALRKPGVNFEIRGLSSYHAKDGVASRHTRPGSLSTAADTYSTTRARISLLISARRLTHIVRAVPQPSRSPPSSCLLCTTRCG